MEGAAHEHLAELSEFLRENAGFEPESLGIQNVAQAIRQCMEANGTQSSREYLRRLQADAAEVQRLLDRIVVPETWFFRDRAAFDCVESRLRTWRPSGGQPVRVLSAACSTGEEVYSLAMTARDAGLSEDQFQVLGTDLSGRSLEFARQGRYAQTAFREQDPRSLALRDRWCEPVGQAWQIRKAIRASVTFRQANLASAGFLAGEPPFQVIFCRNVLIYLHAAARRVALANLRRLLSAGGLLCCAPVEARILGESGFARMSGEYPSVFSRSAELSVAASGGAAALPRGTQRIANGLVNGAPESRGRELRSAVAAGFETRGEREERERKGARAGQSERRGAEIAQVREGLGQGTGRGTEPVPESDWLNAAQRAADEGLLDDAAALCRRVLARDPLNADAFYLSGVVHQSRGDLAAAQQWFEKALYLNPRHYQALVHLMLLAEQRGDREGAGNYRRRAERSASAKSH